MIKLIESSSNTFSFQPTASFADGSSFVYRFTDVFSQDEFIGTATGSNYGRWIKLPINVSTSSYVVGTNISTLPLLGGTYELRIFSGSVSDSVWSTEGRKWDLISDTWSTISGVPTPTGNGIWASRAFVSESIGRTKYSSANENAAYVVYNG